MDLSIIGSFVKALVVSFCNCVLIYMVVVKKLYPEALYI
jgi:hypothetical protein